jgi:hypothetical protein
VYLVLIYMYCLLILSKFMIEYIENNWHETVRIYQIQKKLINDCQHIKQKF